MDNHPTPTHPDLHVLTRLLDRANQVANTTQLDSMLTQLLSLSMEVSHARAGIIYLMGHDTPLEVRAVLGLPTGRHILGTKVESENLLPCRCLLTGKSFAHSLTTCDADEFFDPTILRGMNLINTLVIPIPRQIYPQGVLQLFNLDLNAQPLLHILCDRMASEIQKLLLLHTSEERTHRLQSMVGFLGRIDSSLDPGQILETIIEDASRLLNAEVSSLFLTEEGSNDLVLQISSREDHMRGSPLRVPCGQGIIGHVVRTGETVLVKDISGDHRHYKGLDNATALNTRSLMAVPLCSRPIQLANGRVVSTGKIIGGLEAINKQNGEFDAVDLSLLESFANQAATVLQIANLYKEADELFLDAIRALTAAIDAKDPYTKGHSQRVSDISVAIAVELGMDNEFIHRVRIGSMLHDVGKIGVPDRILRKPGNLTPEEYDEMKEHPLVGERMLQRVRTLSTELAAVSEHHERLDGSGYPRGLRGEEISMIGRIVGVADSFDAMTSDRPYRAALSFDEAFRRLRAKTSNKFDQNCVDALFNIYQNQSLQSLFDHTLAGGEAVPERISARAIAD